MTLIVTANIAGQTRGEPVRLPDRRRRRLSTVVARHKPPPGRRFIVSVHRKGETFLRPTDGSVRLRANWSRTLVGADDVVLVTEVPLGRGIASIGLAIASIALIAVAPYAAPALAGALGGAVSVGAVQAGLVIGGVALGYAAQASAAAKKKTERSLSSVTGGQCGSQVGIDGTGGGYPTYGISVSANATVPVAPRSVASPTRGLHFATMLGSVSGGTGGWQAGLIGSIEL